MNAYLHAAHLHSMHNIHSSVLCTQKWYHGAQFGPQSVHCEIIFVCCKAHFVKYMQAYVLAPPLTHTIQTHTICNLTMPV